VQRNLTTFETQIATVAQSAADEILHNLLLAIDSDSFSGEFDERDAMKPAVEAQLNALMTEAFLLQALGDACIAQHFDACVLQNSGAYAILAICARLCLQHNGRNAMLVEQMREHKASGPCANYSNLSFKLCH
jgi:hypothetical protein